MMADLSDADKRSLMGADYKDKQSAFEKKMGITDETRASKDKASTVSTIIGGSVGLAIVAFLIGLANYYSHGTAYNATLVLACAVIVIASAASAAWLLINRRKTQS